MLPLHNTSCLLELLGLGKPLRIVQLPTCRGRCLHSGRLLSAILPACPQWALPASDFQQHATMPSQVESELFIGPAFNAGGYGW